MLVAFVVLAVGATGGLALAIRPSATPPAGAEARNPIMGAPRISAEGIVAWYRSKRGIPQYRATVPVETLAALFINEGVTENVRGDIAFIQSIKETGWFNFPDYGQVRPGDNNFAGIGACNSCNGGRVFADAQLGVRAQIQHLRNYADPTSRASNLRNPPWVSPAAYDNFLYKGAAPNWEDLNGKWAYPGVGYGESVIDMYADMLQWSGSSWTGPPDARPQSPQTAGSGYYLATPDGGVLTYGAVPFHGSAGGLVLRRPILGIVPTAGARGYYLYSSDGGVFTYGNAPFLGSLGAIRLNNPIVTMARTPSGQGYWMASSDGGVFSFGDAPFLGSLGGIQLSTPIVAGVAARSSRPGYYLLDAAGGVFTFGSARFSGSMAGCFGRRAVSISISPTNRGYWIQTAEGRVMVFGDAKHFGWAFRVNRPPIAISGR